MLPKRSLPSHLNPSAYGAIASSGGASSSASALPSNQSDAASRHVGEVLAQAKRDGVVEGVTNLGKGIPADRKEFFKFRFAEGRNRRAEQGIGETRAAYVAKRLQDKIARLKSNSETENQRRGLRFPGSPEDKERYVRQLTQRKLNEIPGPAWSIVNMDDKSRLAAISDYVSHHLEKVCCDQAIEVRARNNLETQWNNVTLSHIPLVDVVTPEMHAEWERAVEDYAKAKLSRSPSPCLGEPVAKRLRGMLPKSSIDKPQSRPFPNVIWTEAEKEAGKFAPGSLPDCLHVEKAPNTGRAVYVVQSDFMELRRIDAQAHTESMLDMPALTLAIASHMAWQKEQSVESFGFSDDILKAAQSIAHEDSHCEGLRQYADGAYRARYKRQDLPRVAPHGALDGQKAKTVAIARILSAVAADKTLKGNRHYCEYEQTKDAKALLPLIERKETTSLRDIIAPAFGDLSIPSLKRIVQSARVDLEWVNLVKYPQDGQESESEKIQVNGIYFGAMSTRQFPHESADEVQLRAATATILAKEYLQFVDRAMKNSDMRERIGIASVDDYIISRIEQEVAKHVGDGIEGREAYIESRIDQEVKKLQKETDDNRRAEFLAGSLMGSMKDRIQLEAERSWAGVSRQEKAVLATRYENPNWSFLDRRAYEQFKIETKKDVREMFYQRELGQFARANLSAEWSRNKLQDFHQRQMEWDFRLREGDLAERTKKTFRAEWYNVVEDYARSYFVALYKPRLRDMPIEIIRDILNQLPPESQSELIEASEKSETLKYKVQASAEPTLASKLFEQMKSMPRTWDAATRLCKFEGLLKDVNDLATRNRVTAYVALATAPRLLKDSAGAGTELFLERVKKLFDDLDLQYRHHPDRDKMTRKWDKEKYQILIGIASPELRLKNYDWLKKLFKERIYECIDPLFALLESIEDKRIINNMEYRGFVTLCLLLPSLKGTAAYLGRLVSFVEKRMHRLSDGAKEAAIVTILEAEKAAIIGTQEQQLAATKMMAQLINVAETIKDDNAMLRATCALLNPLLRLGEATDPACRAVVMFEHFASVIRSPEVWFEFNRVQKSANYRALLARVRAA